MWGRRLVWIRPRTVDPVIAGSSPVVPASLVFPQIGKKGESMEDIGLTALKTVLLILSCIGIIFHLLVLRNPERGQKIEEKLGAELGVKKKFIPWLEESRLGLQQKLINSKLYNVFAVIFLIALLILLTRW